MNWDAWAPAVTAALVLLNTAITVWNNRKIDHVKHKVNGMYLQTLADAEYRGRMEATSAVSAMAPTERAQGESPKR